MTDDTSNNLGLGIDEELQQGIPAQPPSFITQVDEQGQVELAVQEQEQEQEEVPAHSPAQLEHSNADEDAVQHVTEVQQPEHELPPANHNRPADPAEMRRDFFKDVNKFGKASGEGASALGRLGLRSLRAAGRWNSIHTEAHSGREGRRDAGVRSVCCDG